MRIDCYKCGRWFKPKNKKLSNYHLCPSCDKGLNTLRDNFKDPEFVKQYDKELAKEAKD